MKLFDNFTIQLWDLLPPVIYIILGVISYQIIKKIANRIAKGKVKLKKRHYQKRAETIKTILLNVIKYVIVIIVIVSILPTFGINVKTLVTGLGVTAAIIGLAFQDIAKDFLAGITIIAEDQFEIGDTVEINGFRGEVTFVGLRTTRVRDYTGATLIIGNHNINQVINYNLHNSLAIVDVNVSHDYESDMIIKLLEKIAKKMDGKLENTKKPIEVLGIQELGNTSIKYRMMVETKALQNFEIERRLRTEIKKEFEKQNIKFPYSQIEGIKNDKQ